jgi:hypothetical protein
MKYLLTAAVLAFAAPAHAEYDGFCRDAAELVESAAEARDKGVPMSALFNVMDETMADTPNLLKYTQENVRVIYEQPSLSPVVIKSIFIGVCMSEIGQ